MDLVERYIYAVTKRLPLNQRTDIEKELNGLIEDMLSERCGNLEPNKEDIEAILLELGEPSLLADQYRGTKRFLIGPANFDNYLFILKIVLAAVAVGLTLALAVEYVVNPPHGPLDALGNYFSSMITALLQVFAWATIIFAAVEHFGVNMIKLPAGKKWSPSDLPHIPKKAATIKPIEPITGILFTVLLIILFNTVNHLIGFFHISPDSNVTVIPLFSQETLSGFLPLFNVLFALAIVKECVKLVIGRWTVSLAIISSVMNVVSFIIVVMVFTNYAIWNDHFPLHLIQIGIIPDSIDINTFWGYFTKGLIGIVALAMIVDTIDSLVKAFKHKVASYL